MDGPIFGWMILNNWLIYCWISSIDQLTNLFTYLLTDWSVNSWMYILYCLICLIIDLLINWLTDQLNLLWLTDCSIHCLTERSYRDMNSSGAEQGTSVSAAPRDARFRKSGHRAIEAYRLSLMTALGSETGRELRRSRHLLLLALWCSRGPRVDWLQIVRQGCAVETWRSGQHRLTIHA